MEGPQEGQHNNLLIGWQGKFKMQKSPVSYKVEMSEQNFYMTLANMVLQREQEKVIGK